MSGYQKSKEITPWTVTQLTARVKELLEDSFVDLWITGEISNLRPAGSGHVYFNLKDKDAVLRGVMWRSDAQRLRFQPQDGLEVIVHGRLTVYPPRGDYQVTVDQMIPRGAGEQDLALRQLKEKLQKLGYFARERKKPLPRWPRRLALITSPTGAAIRDMLEILSRRWPLAEVLVCPVRVQGAGAAQDIAQALDRINRLAGIDVAILGRGGGSSEDLGAFNEEMVARAIFVSKIPIIAAVGHEIDVTIADLVADCRALTPSEAVERATPDREELLQKLRTCRARLDNLARGQVESLGKRVLDLAQRRVLRQPLERLRDQERRIDEIRDRLDRAVRQRLVTAQGAAHGLVGRLNSLSPLNVLTRGYSLTRIEKSKVLVQSAQQIQPGTRVEILVRDGLLLGRIDEVLDLPRELITLHE